MSTSMSASARRHPTAPGACNKLPAIEGLYFNCVGISPPSPASSVLTANPDRSSACPFSPSRMQSSSKDRPIDPLVTECKRAEARARRRATLRAMAATSLLFRTETVRPAPRTGRRVAGGLKYERVASELPPT